MLLTAASWFILGIWLGLGYCACTDWHWQVREHLGYNDQQRSYIHFLILKITGLDLDETFVDNTTLVIFLVVFVISVWLNIRDTRNRVKR
jgi:hypothetical protein